AAAPPRPRDVVLLLDRSGSMQGWKMVAARRAAARIIDTLTGADRFAVLTFDDRVERPPLPDGLVPATDRNRFRAVEHLARVDARGGTELLAPLTAGLDLLGRGEEGAGPDGTGRDRVLVLVTDGQVGNEDQILARTGPAMAGVRVHTVGIDQAVNAGFLGRLALAGGGRCELVESEDRLDEAMQRIHRRIGAALVTGLRLEPIGFELVPQTLAPARLPDLFPGAPLLVTGRYRAYQAGPDQAGPDQAGMGVVVHGRGPGGAAWSASPPAVSADDPAVVAVWARAHLRDLEDAYLGHQYQVGADPDALEQRIIATSLRFGVLCRFTAWLAVDQRVVADGQLHRVVQPVEPAAGWDLLADRRGPAGFAAPMRLAAQAAPAMMPAPASPVRPMLSGAPVPPPLGSPRGWRRLSRTGSAPRAAKGRPVPAAAPPSRSAEVAATRTLAAAEVARLRAAGSLTVTERRETLADLGSRLRAMLRHLTDLGVAPAELVALRELVDQLDADRPLLVPQDAFTQLWDRTLRVLEAFAEARPGPAASDGRKRFWRAGG
ncbi:MAG TPA: VWA domain-containing protein, partial [Micromonosporaceae bacterium]